MKHRAPTPAAFPLRVALGLIFASGLAGLGYQTTWIRLFSAGLGHEVPAVVSVLAAFLGGVAAGAWTSERLLAQPGRHHAARWLARLELTVGGWSVVTAWLIPALNEWMVEWLGPAPSPAVHWLTVFVVPGVTLLPATMAMGATLPVMLRWTQRSPSEPPLIGAVYFANTAGAALGTLAGTAVLLPAVGLRGSLLVLATINVLVAVAVRRVTAHAGVEQKSSTSTSTISTTAARRTSTTGSDLPDADLSERGWLMIAFGGGYLAIAFELAGLRGLTQVLDNTAYTFAAILAVYLAGTALGGAWFQRFLARRPARTLLPGLLAALVGAIVIAAWSLRLAPALHPAVRAWLSRAGPWGDALAGAVLAELALAATVFAVPTLLMGALFSLVLASATRRGPSHAGRLLAWNTFGCTSAAVTVMLLWLPGAGLRGTLLAIAIGYGLLVGPCLARVAWRRAAWRPLAAGLAVAFFPGQLHLLQVPEGDTVAAEREGVLATAAVLRSPDGQRTLRVNNRVQMGGTAAAVAERRQAHLPLLLHPEPHRALFLGPGTGITLGAAAAHPDLEITAVELLPEVVEVMPNFEPENAGPYPNDHVQLKVADARRFVRTHTGRYDVIVADLFHPSQDGAGFLYTREHFAAIRGRLSETGLFCQWLPLHQLDDPTLQVIVRTFVDVFPDACALLLHLNVDIPVLGLIGGRARPDLDPGHLERRLASPQLKAALRGVGLDRPIAVLGCVAGDTQSMRDYAGAATVATDLRPAVLFLAPRHSARTRAASDVTLFHWLSTAGPARRLAALTAGGEPTEFTRALSDYIEARDVYLRGLAREAAQDLSGAIDLYLESSGRSLYFTPAYARLVTVIQVMAPASREQARDLWHRLAAVRPDQPLGERLLAPLFATNGPASGTTITNAAGTPATPAPKE